MNHLLYKLIGIGRGFSQTAYRQESDSPNRFYEGLCSPYPYEPTRDRLTVVPSGEKGEGLVTLLDIKKGELVFQFWGRSILEQTLFTLQKSPGLFIEDPFVMGKVLHSCDPNMDCDMETQTFTARRSISAGDYLTMDYETTEDALYRTFNCQCGALACRGPIYGRMSQQQEPAFARFANG